MKNKPITILFSALAVILLSLLFVDPKIYSSFITLKLSRFLSGPSVKVLPEDAKLKLIGLNSNTVTVIHQKNKLVLKDLILRLSPLSLLKLQARLKLQAEVFSGKLNLNALSSLNGITSNLSGNLHEISIRELAPQLAAELFSGKLNCEFKKVLIEQGKLRELTASFHLKDLSRKEDGWVQGEKLGLRTNFILPAFSKAWLKGIIELKNRNLHLADLALSANLGKASGAGSITLDSYNKPQTLDLVISVELSKQGMSQFGAFLPVVGLKKDNSSFDIRIKGPANAPRVSFKA